MSSKLDSNTITNAIKIIFKITCIVAATTLVMMQILKFCENEDKPVISFKEFNQSPNDKYPTYTICFESMEKNGIEKGGLFKDGYEDYEKFIKGKETNESLMKEFSRIKYEDATKGVNELIAGYDLITTDDATTGFIACPESATRKGGTGDIMRLEGKLLVSNCPFYRSYQDPKRICLTRKDIYTPDRTYLSEEVDLFMNTTTIIHHAKKDKDCRKSKWKKKDCEFVTLGEGTLDDYWTNTSLYLNTNRMLRYNVYIHHPEQGLRTFFKRFEMKKVFNGDSFSVRKNSIQVMLSGISILKKRLDGNDHCYPGHFDDKRIYGKVFNYSLCVPPYWKRFVPKGMNVTECKDSLQLRNMNTMINGKDVTLNPGWDERDQQNEKLEIPMEEIRNDLSLPCEDMSFSMSMERPENGEYNYFAKRQQLDDYSLTENKLARVCHKDKHCNIADGKYVLSTWDPKFCKRYPCYKIKFTYLNERYQEIRNERDFDIGMCWAKVCSFVGVFLGFCLLDLLEFLSYEILSWGKKK